MSAVWRTRIYDTVEKKCIFIKTHYINIDATVEYVLGVVVDLKSAVDGSADLILIYFLTVNYFQKSLENLTTGRPRRIDRTIYVFGGDFQLFLRSIIFNQYFIEIRSFEI